MNIKHYLFAGLFLVSTAGSFSVVQASDTIILAQNQQQEKRGFFGRIFNKSDKPSSAQPLFLDQSQDSSSGARAIKPYNNYGRQPRSTFGAKLDLRVESDPLTAQMILARNESIEADYNRTMLKVRKMQELRKKRSAQERGSGDEGSQKQTKRMVYDPQKARNYDPNKSRSGSHSNGKIYNTR